MIQPGETRTTLTPLGATRLDRLSVSSVTSEAAFCRFASAARCANDRAIMNSLVANVALLGSFLAVILAVFLIVVPSRSRFANVLFALFLVATAIDISAWFMGDWWRANPGMSQFRPIVSPLQMPLFAGSIWHTCVQDRRLRTWDLAHLIPALVVLGCVLAGLPMPWLRAMLEIQYVGYIAFVVLILWRFHRRLRANFVGQSRTLRWLSILVASSLVAHAVYVVRTLMLTDLDPAVTGAMQSVSGLLVLAITIWIAFEALLNPQTFRGSDRLLASASKMVEGEASDEWGELSRFVEQQRPYLDPNLSLEKLARRSGIGAKRISDLINRRCGVHFFDYINRFRVGHAKSLLKDTDRPITEILYEAGFNSKSSFNSAFRKHAGMTPSAFRRDHREE